MNKAGQTSQRTNKLRDELILDDSGHVTKVVRIIAPKECQISVSIALKYMYIMNCGELK